MVYGEENNGVGGEGSRLMAVRANGQPLLSHFDVMADAGGDRITDDRVFPGLSPAKDGRLHLEFAGENGTNATLRIRFSGSGGAHAAGADSGAADSLLLERQPLVGTGQLF